eukprot:tig00021037_g17444.t1
MAERVKEPRALLTTRVITVRPKSTWVYGPDGRPVPAGESREAFYRVAGRIHGEVQAAAPGSVSDFAYGHPVLLREDDGVLSCRTPVIAAEGGPRWSLWLGVDEDDFLAEVHRAQRPGTPLLSSVSAPQSNVGVIFGAVWTVAVCLASAALAYLVTRPLRNVAAHLHRVRPLARPPAPPAPSVFARGRCTYR